MKTFSLLFALGCSSLVLLEDSAQAAPRLALSAWSGLSNPATKIGLNPQPLPPRWNPPSRFINPGSKVGLNPQPLPPRLFKKF